MHTSLSYLNSEHEDGRKWQQSNTSRIQSLKTRRTPQQRETTEVTMNALNKMLNQTEIFTHITKQQNLRKKKQYLEGKRKLKQNIAAKTCPLQPCEKRECFFQENIEHKLEQKWVPFQQQQNFGYTEKEYGTSKNNKTKMCDG